MIDMPFYKENKNSIHTDPNTGHTQPTNPRPHPLTPESVRKITDSVVGKNSLGDCGHALRRSPDSKVESAAAGNYARNRR